MDSLLFRLYNPEPPVIHVGAWYRIQKHTDAGEPYVVKLRAVKRYRHHWLFESAAGCRECITHWELARVVR